MPEQRVIHGDCLVEMAKMEAASIDVICTDPPYNLEYNGRSKDHLGARTFDTFANDAMEHDEYAEFVGKVCAEWGRVAKPTAAVYCFIDWRNYPLWAAQIEKHFAPVKNCIVWDKGSMGMGAFYRYQHEFCIFSVRGEYKLNRHDLTDVWYEKREHTGDYQHPTQKPISLMQKIVNDTPEDALILDTFMGSGTTLVAAKMAARNAIGIEMSPEYIEVAKGRLSQGMLF